MKSENLCYKELTQASQSKAAAADSRGDLDTLDGKLQCECGASVGAKKSSSSEDAPEYSPRNHEPFKGKPRPAFKSDRGKA